MQQPQPYIFQTTEEFFLSKYFPLSQQSALALPHSSAPPPFVRPASGKSLTVPESNALIQHGLCFTCLNIQQRK